MSPIEESDPMAEKGRLAETSDPLFEQVVGIVKEVLMPPIHEGADPAAALEVHSTYRQLARIIERQARQKLRLGANSLVDAEALLQKVREVAVSIKAQTRRQGSR